MITSKKLLIHCLIFAMTFFANDLLGQKENDHRNIYLLSNLGDLSADASEFDAIQKLLEKEKNEFTILVLGDFVDKKNQKDELTKNEKDRLKRLIDLTNDRGEILFTTGDVEWNHGVRKGWKKVIAVEKYLEKQLGKGKAVFPQKACLGPEVVDIGEHIRIVTINSQWFVQKNDRPEVEDAVCTIFNETEFWDEMDDLLADSENRNLIVAMHHPILSFGQFAGYKLHAQHFSPPIIGSFKVAYHQNVGNSTDLSKKELKEFANKLLDKAERHPNVIFVSGHEYDVQVLLKDGSYHINSGAIAKARPVAKGKETIYRQNKTGLAKLLFDKNGKVEVQTFRISNRKNIIKTFEKTLFESPCLENDNNTLVNNLYNPCPTPINTAAEINRPSSGTAIAGERYKAGGIKQLVFGKNYRKTWATPVHQIPYLDLDTLDGGIKPYAKGGGMQTTSLKFKSKNGRRFTFRLLDKNPTKKLSKELKVGIMGNITQDLTSLQIPYGSLIAAYFMDVIGLPHSMPKLYLMPNDPKLGGFRKEFAGKFGYMELKPKGKKKDKEGFLGADKVVGFYQMYRKILDDNDNEIDVQEYVTARILDIFLNDWDRHEGNWKWLAYKKDKGYLYKPFPVDRDKAFYVLNGFLRLAEFDFVAKDGGHFRENFGNMKSNNFKAKNMDRWLTDSFTHEDWMKEAKRIQNLLTDEVIDKAIAAMPVEVQPVAGPRMKRVLTARRNDLAKAIDHYYRMIAEYFNLVGSNKGDLFELTRLSNGDVNVKKYKFKDGEKGKMLLDRTFKINETKEIRLYGLGKKDAFHISGEAEESILIRVIGGDESDTIVDKSQVHSGGASTLVYDKRQKDEVTLNSEVKMMKTPDIITFETNKLFTYNYLKVLPAFSFNEDDGYVFGLSGSYIKQKFNKLDFGSKLLFNASITTNDNFSIGTELTLRHVIGKWDLVMGIQAANNDRTFQQFYGLGNETIRDDDLEELDFYKNNTQSLKSHFGFTRFFWERSSFTPSFKLDMRDVQPDPEDGQETTIYDQLSPQDGLGKSTLLGPQINFILDFRDNANFPQRGLYLKANNFTFLNSDLDWNLGGKVDTEITTFITRGIRRPMTLSIKGGVAHAYGKTPFYYKSYLGQQANHRGFLRNRFGGNTAAYLNTDLRFHFGKVVTRIVPFKYGVFALLDVGKVWQGEEDSDVSHTAIGGGFYLIPYSDDFNINFTIARADSKDLLFSFNFGFFVR